MFLLVFAVRFVATIITKQLCNISKAGNQADRTHNYSREKAEVCNMHVKSAEKCIPSLDFDLICHISTGFYGYVHFDYLQNRTKNTYSTFLTKLHQTKAPIHL
jgi:hypothetical protein